VRYLSVLNFGFSLVFMKKKIDVIMFATSHLETYTQYAIPTWEKYCAVHGYRFFHYSDAYYDDLHLVWSKIRSVREHLYQHDCDYLLMVDADTIPTSFELSIEEILAEFMTPNKQILFQKDGSNRLHYLYFPHNLKLAFRSKKWILPNAGFILMKNNDAVKAFFDEWLARAYTSPYANQPPRNQQVLTYEMLTQTHIETMVGYVETWVVNKFKGKLCQHFSSKTPEQIAALMLPFYRELVGSG